MSKISAIARCGTLTIAAVTSVWAFNSIAQPTGNPKGSVPPVESNAPKAPAGSGGPRNETGTDTGKIVDKPAGAAARTQAKPTPGSGTAGGLTKRDSQTADPASKGNTSSGPAGPKLVPPQ